jgi:hypothetical protein
VWESFLEWAKEHLSDWTMSKIYIACAVAGGAVIIGQTGLNLFGLGGDTDVDPDVDVDDLEGADGLNFLSIRALAGFLTFFGLVGWGGTASGWGTGLSALAAFGAGSVVMIFVAVTMRFFTRLASSGNIDPAGAVGKVARVYLRIPANKTGKGKISLSLQGRSVEFQALTAGDELPSGSECRILRKTSDDTFEVEALD